MKWSYRNYPLNAWVYGISFLLILLFPAFLFLYAELFSEPEMVLSIFENGFERYTSVMLFPYEFSSKYLFQMPGLGIIIAVLSYVLHAHVYSLILERISLLFRR